MTFHRLSIVTFALGRTV